MPDNKQVLDNIRRQIFETSNLEYFDIHIARYHQILDIIASLNLPLNAKILDIGCYPPHLYDALKAKGYIMSGISSEHESLSTSRIKTVNIETQPLPFKNNSFDLVLFTEVFEHIQTNHAGILSEIKRILSPHGLLLLTTPNAIRLQNLVKLFFGQNIYFPLFQLEDNPNHRHNREFTMDELKLLIDTSGLLPVKTNYLISYPPNRHRNRSDSLLLKAIKYLNYWLMRVMVNRRDTLYLIAKKVTA